MIHNAAGLSADSKAVMFCDAVKRINVRLTCCSFCLSCSYRQKVRRVFLVCCKYVGNRSNRQLVVYPPWQRTSINSGTYAERSHSHSNSCTVKTSINNSHTRNCSFCQVMEPPRREVQNWFTEFRSFPDPVTRTGSFALRSF